MGAVNFSYCNILNKTFGFESEVDADEWDVVQQRDSVEQDICDYNENHPKLFELELSEGYYDGAVIHARPISSQWSDWLTNEGKPDVEAMQHDINGLVNNALERTEKISTSYISSFDNVAEKVISHFFDYIEYEMPFAFDDIYSYLMEKKDKINEIAMRDKTPSMYSYRKAIRKVMPSKTVDRLCNEFFESALAEVNEAVYEIAKSNNLKQLQGRTWTSGLVEVDYDEAVA